ncbi:hypothetical protein TNCV_4210111 [Trichonephila clavipes]|nr:hypothetical protein TNCV_4210111 [Trichonephila clavipes]
MSRYRYLSQTLQPRSDSIRQGQLEFNCDSRASMQHLSSWTTVRDMTNLNILDLRARLSSRHYILSMGPFSYWIEW